VAGSFLRPSPMLGRLGLLCWPPAHTWSMPQCVVKPHHVLTAGVARAVPRPTSTRDRCHCVAHPWSWESDATHPATVVTPPLRERDIIWLPPQRRRLCCAAGSAYLPDVIARGSGHSPLTARGEGSRSRHYVKGRWLRLLLQAA
jgi:hypothetical protein